MLSNLLLFRLIIVNTVGAAATFYAWQRGYVHELFTTDTTNISYAIAALFVVGLLSTFNRAIKVGASINEWKALTVIGGSSTKVRNKAAKLAIKNAHIWHIVRLLTGLGLFGTVVGLRVALSGEAMDDPALVQQGIYTAIGTTIIGLSLSIWLGLSALALTTATRSHMEDCK